MKTKEYRTLEDYDCHNHGVMIGKLEKCPECRGVGCEWCKQYGEILVCPICHAEPYNPSAWYENSLNDLW